MLFYIVWAVVWTGLIAVVLRGLKYQPVVVLGICGPVVATIVVAYGQALGKLAKHLQETSEVEDDDDE